MDEPFQTVMTKKRKKKLENRITDDNYYDVLSRMHVDDDVIENNNSESDDSAEQQNATKKSKNQGLNFSDHDPHARHVIIKCLDIENPMALAKLDTFRKSDFLEEKIGSFPSVRTLTNGSLLVETETSSQVGQLIEIEDVVNIPVHAEIAYHIGTVRGVVDDASICDKSEEEVLAKLKSQNVVNVRPIFKGEGPSKERTKYTILSFRLNKLPSHVYFGRVRHKLKPYRMKVIQCNKCWWFGHHTNRCKRSSICKACGGRGEDHDNDACLADPGIQIKCSNCSGTHPADDKKCPVWKKQLDIKHIRSQHQVGYHKAVEILKKKNRNADNNGWDGTDATAPGGGRGGPTRPRPAPPAGPVGTTTAVGQSWVVTPSSSGANNNRGGGGLPNNVPTPMSPTISVGARTPNNYSGAVKSPPPGPRRNPVSLQAPKGAQATTSIRTHGPSHTLSSSGSDSEGETQSQVLPRRTNFGGHLRPVPNLNLNSNQNSNQNQNSNKNSYQNQTLAQAWMSQYGRRPPGHLPEGEDQEVPARRPILRDSGTQTDTYAHKGVQTDNFLELEAVMSILRSIPLMCTYENDSFQFSQNKLLTVLNRSLGLELTPEYIQDVLSR